MKKPVTITGKEVEICHLELKYAHTRIRNEKAISRLCASILRFGQITPVIVAPAEAPGYILIDGYLRVAALRRCGRDTVDCHVCSCDEQEALIQVFARTQDRKWEIFEQAVLIRSIHLNFGLSQASIAGLLGKDKSFVSRRLALLDLLDDDMREYVQQGRICLWSAARVLAPMARANAEHAKILAKKLSEQPVATRDLAILFTHYKTSNKKNRREMVERPHLFLKALETKRSRGEAATLADGPEGKWLKDIQIVKHMLFRLNKQSNVVFHKNQPAFDRRLMLTAFSDAKTAFLQLDERLRRCDDLFANTADDSGVAQKRGSETSNQQIVESLPQGRAASDSQGGEKAPEAIHQ